MASENFTTAVREWVISTRQVASQVRSLEEAGKRRAKASNKLAKLIVPVDMEVGETISVWVSTGFREERLITVRFKDRIGEIPQFDVAFRGKARDELT